MCGSLEIDSAIDVVQGLSKSMDMYRREASEGKLLLLPGETVSAGREVGVDGSVFCGDC